MSNLHALLNNKKLISIGTVIAVLVVIGHWYIPITMLLLQASFVHVTAMLVPGASFGVAMVFMVLDWVPRQLLPILDLCMIGLPYLILAQISRRSPWPGGRIYLVALVILALAGSFTSLSSREPLWPGFAYYVFALNTVLLLLSCALLFILDRFLQKRNSEARYIPLLAALLCAYLAFPFGAGILLESVMIPREVSARRYCESLAPVMESAFANGLLDPEMIRERTESIPQELDLERHFEQSTNLLQRQLLIDVSIDCDVYAWQDSFYLGYRRHSLFGWGYDYYDHAERRWREIRDSEQAPPPRGWYWGG